MAEPISKLLLIQTSEDHSSARTLQWRDVRNKDADDVKQ